MIEIVINYDPVQKMFKAYEPQTDTLLITTSLGETFIKLDDVLKKNGLITVDILTSIDIVYHIDSYTFLGLIENNVALLKRLNTAPSGFMTSNTRFGLPQSGSNTKQKDWGRKNKKFGGGGTFSKSSFNKSNKKFGGNSK